MHPIYFLRSPGQIAKGVMVVVLGLGVVFLTIIDNVKSPLGPPIMWCVGLCCLGVALYFSPRIVLSKDQLVLHNWIRTLRIPWSEVKDTNYKFGLQIVSSVTDPASAFPGAGWMHIKHSMPNRVPKVSDSGIHKLWLNTPEAKVFIDRYKEFQAEETAEKSRKVEYNNASIATFCLGTICLVAGIIWALN